MKPIVVLTIVVGLSGGLIAQEPKPVPKDSVRVAIPGCAKGYVFTVGRRTEDQPGTTNLPEGLHLRMNGPKKLISDISARRGSMVEITGLMKQTEYSEGIKIGALRIGPGSTRGSLGSTPLGSQMQIDVEGFRPIPGSCPK